MLTSADRESDPVNRTLSRLGKTTCYGSGYYPWTSCEYNSYDAFFYNGSAGSVVNYNEYRDRRASGFRFVKTVFSF